MKKFLAVLTLACLLTGCAAGATDAVRACVSGTSASCSCRAAAIVTKEA